MRGRAKGNSLSFTGDSEVAIARRLVKVVGRERRHNRASMTPWTVDAACSEDLKLSQHSNA